MKQAKEKDPYKMTTGQMLAWNGRGVSIAANVVVLTYLTFYCTNMLGLPAALTGTLLLVSKVFDGFTDLVAGFIIEKTNTRFGKARPYEFSIIGVWLCTILLYSCPDFGTTGKCIWVFVMYTFVNSIFATFLSSAETVYLARAFKYEEDRIKLASVSGILVMLFCTIVSMVFPILMGELGTSKGGWTTIASIFAIPLLLLGITRFFFVKEKVEVDAEAASNLTVSDFLEGLKSNKYIYLLFFVSLLTFIVSNMGNAVGTYYFEYIVGDVKKMSVIGMLGLVTPVALMFCPLILRKISTSQMILIGGIVGAVGCVIKGFAGTNMVILIIGNLLATLSVLPLSYFAALIVIDIMDYHECKTGKRVEAVFGSIYGLSSKLGAGLASGLVGLVMGMSGFDGMAAVQSDEAIHTIISLYSWIPAVLMAITSVLMMFFDLEKKLPQMKEEYQKKKTMTDCE
ncbi:MAG: MFS transporter [Lachnospiraceae bacterium]|nr:MFS transporter [Lachnospiraceae bacterium]